MTAPVVPDHFGATQAEWTHWSNRLGLTADLLPAVMDPDAKPTAGSSLRAGALAKVPSMLNSGGLAHGFHQWPTKQSTAAEVAQWAEQPALGICLQSRNVQAIDVDIDDADTAAAVEDFIIGCLFGRLPKRARASSPRFVLAFRLDTDGKPPRKRTIKTAHGVIEFLGDGNQFLVAGRHKSGDRYEWDGGLPDTIPSLSLNHFEYVWSELVETFGVEPPVMDLGRDRRRGDTNPDAVDEVADYLTNKGLVIGRGRDGELHIKCPWSSEHTSASGPSSTVWFLAGTNGYQRGHFKCLHAHCHSRTDSDFTLAIGFDIAQFDTFVDAPTGNPETGLQLIDVGDWQGLPVPEREWIVPGWILPRAVTLIAGAGGTGKSLLIQQWLSAIALGDPFVGICSTAPMPVLYINCEDDQLELHRRQAAIAVASLRELSEYSGKMSIAVRLGFDNPLGVVDQLGVFKPTQLYNELRDSACRRGVRVIALDNAMQLFVGNLNDPLQVTRFCNALARLALDIDGAVILAGHIAKADGSQFAGTMAWENSVRSRLFLERETVNGEELEQSDRRYLSRGKANYARKGDRLAMTWHNGAFHSDTPNAVGLNITETHDEDAFLRCLDAATAQRRNVSDKPSVSYAPKIFSKMKERGNVNKAALERAMERLFNRGEIIANTFLWKDEKGRSKSGIVRVEHTAEFPPNRPPERSPDPNIPFTRTTPHTPVYTSYIGAGPEAHPPQEEGGLFAAAAQTPPAPAPPAPQPRAPAPGGLLRLCLQVARLDAGNPDKINALVAAHSDGGRSPEDVPAARRKGFIDALRLL